MERKLSEAIKKAQEEVAQLNITDPDLRKIAFEKAIDYFLNGRNEKFHLTIGGVGGQEIEVTGDFWSKLSTATGLEIAMLKDIYSVKKEQIRLFLPSVPGKLRQDKQRNLALLVILAYQEGFGYEYTSSSLLAEAASHSNLYDKNYFAANLKMAWFRSEGKKRGLKYRLSGPGIGAAKEFLNSLTRNHE